MTIQQMLDSGHVDVELPTEMLEEAIGAVGNLLKGLRGSQWEESVGELTIRKYERLEERIIAVLNQRHGADGMTHLTG